MKNRILLVTMMAAVLFAVATRPAHAWSRPETNLAVGGTLGATGAPAGGGISAAVSPMWAIGDHARFGVTLFADDIGSDLTDLRDPHNGVSLGTYSRLHRWTWGGAWRGDVEVAHPGRWTAAASGTWGWWRIEDDAQGTTTSAASAVGVGIGGELRRPVATAQTLGLIVRWQRLFAERNSAYRRVEHYASAAVEWGWAAAPRP